MRSAAWCLHCGLRLQPHRRRLKATRARLRSRIRELLPWSLRRIPRQLRVHNHKFRAPREDGNILANMVLTQTQRALFWVVRHLNIWHPSGNGYLFSKLVQWSATGRVSILTRLH